jgi:protein gp37
MNLDKAETIARPVIKEFIEKHHLDVPTLRRLTHGAQKFGKSWAIIVGLSSGRSDTDEDVEWFRVIVNDATQQADMVIQRQWGDICKGNGHA